MLLDWGIVFSGDLPGNFRIASLSRLLVPNKLRKMEIERVEKLFLYDKYGG
jgi:hypothetical protein